MSSKLLILAGALAAALMGGCAGNEPDIAGNSAEEGKLSLYAAGDDQGATPTLSITNFKVTA